MHRREKSLSRDLLELLEEGALRLADPPMPSDQTVEVLWEDNACLAVAKPAGIATEGPPADRDTLVLRIKNYLRRKHQKTGNVYLGIPHRLDRAVSGVVLFARNSKCAARLAEQFRQRQVRKIYWCVTSAAPDPPAGTLRDWLAKPADRPRSRIAVEGDPGAREAILSYRMLAEVRSGWLIEVELVTGRFHQIRVQFAHRGWGIVGDDLYAGRTAEGEDPVATVAGEPHGARAIALHARRLTFLHPIRYDSITLEAPSPAAWLDWLGEGFAPPAS